MYRSNSDRLGDLLISAGAVCLVVVVIAVVMFR